MEKRGIRTALTGEHGWVHIMREDALEQEQYRILITEQEIVVYAGAERGVIWALTTLIRLLAERKEPILPVCRIEDRPLYAHRGLSLDVARRFFQIEEVKNIIEEISMVKMNVLHWHLTDDQRWRIESKKFPELCRCSGEYYTQDEIKEVVAFAKVRGIEEIPEVEMPGHTRGILAAYPSLSCSGKKVRLAKTGGIYKRILCAGAEQTYEFLEELLGEICVLFSSERFHIGGDEAPKVEWKVCPCCQARIKGQKLKDANELQGYFAVRVSDILKKYGKKPICWNDSLMSAVRPEEMQVQYWSVQYNKEMEEFIKNGGTWIYSDMFELYLDYPYSMTSVRKIYENQIDLRSRKYDLHDAPYGMEACIWGEHIATESRLEELLFPRVYAMAEVSWSGAERYEDFEKRLVVENKRLEESGIHVTAAEHWNPEGQEREQESFAYMKSLNPVLSEDEQQEVVDPSDTGEEFRQKFMSRFLEANSNKTD
jgi:hexosaminidase